MNALMKASKTIKQSTLTNFFNCSVKRSQSIQCDSKTIKIDDINQTSNIIKNEDSILSNVLNIQLPVEEETKIETLKKCIPVSWKEDFVFNVEGTWSSLLQEEHSKPYFQRILKKLKEDETKGVVIFPKRENVFKALQLCSFENVKVIILGQDPYHDVGQAHGLSFSVPNGVPIPPSLRNIFKEISTDMNIPVNKYTDLTCWAKQGVLLLNTLLTVPAHTPMGYKDLGWDTYTSEIIKLISKKSEHKVFLLWGRPAQSKMNLIDKSKHLILTSVHPSPLSANRGFFGCKHFSKTNTYLKSNGDKEIDWHTYK